MGNVQRQRGNIVLYKEKKEDGEYIRIDYAGNREIHELLTQDTGIKAFGYGSAYITADAFKLPDFYDRYSPPRLYRLQPGLCQTPQTSKGIHTAGRILGTAGTKAL